MKLKQLGRKVDARVYDDGKKPRDIAKAAIKASKEEVLIFDSAGRDALDRELGLGAGASRPEVVDAMQGHILAQGVLMGTYHR